MLEQIAFCHKKKAEAFPRNFLPTKEDSIRVLAKINFAKIDRKKNIKIGKNNLRMGANTFEARTYGLVGKTTKLRRRHFASFVVVDKPIHSSTNIPDLLRFPNRTVIFLIARPARDLFINNV